MTIWRCYLFWWAGKLDSGLGIASDAESHDDSIAVEGDKLVIRQQTQTVPVQPAADLPANEKVR